MADQKPLGSGEDDGGTELGGLGHDGRVEVHIDLDTQAVVQEDELLKRQGIPIFLAYAFLTSLNQMIWIQCAPIKDKVLERFNIPTDSASMVDAASICYNVVYLILFYPSSVCSKRKAFVSG